MAAGRKKKQKRFSFQLGFTGLAGITVVFFCLFLWMFLLGVWAGQAILLPPVSGNQLQINSNLSKDIPAPAQLPVIYPDGRKKVIKR
jgi:hypothetical protein